MFLACLIFTAAVSFVLGVVFDVFFFGWGCPSYIEDQENPEPEPILDPILEDDRCYNTLDFYPCIGRESCTYTNSQG